MLLILMAPETSGAEKEPITNNSVETYLKYAEAIGFDSKCCPSCVSPKKDTREAGGLGG